MSETAAVPRSMEAIQEAVRSTPRLLPRGGGTKPALSTPPRGVTTLEIGGLRGVVEYDPGEFTITALAGTPLADLEAELAAHGQYLPFDPPLVASGASVGGAVAAGLSGSGRWRYGGVRDFVLQVRYVDAGGSLVRGGARVVKNVAGFDLPRVMVGSLGRLGVLVEVTFKVLPLAEARATLCASFASLAAASSAMSHLASAPLELEALDLTADEHVSLWIRVGGLRDGLPRRIERIAALTEEHGGRPTGDPLEGEADIEVWHAAREFAWVPIDWALAAVPLIPTRIGEFAEAVASSGTLARYCVGGNLCYLAWPEADTDTVTARLQRRGLGALVIRGSTPQPLLGVPRHAFAERVTSALDPAGRFVAL